MTPQKTLKRAEDKITSSSKKLSENKIKTIIEHFEHFNGGRKMGNIQENGKFAYSMKTKLSDKTGKNSECSKGVENIKTDQKTIKNFFLPQTEIRTIALGGPNYTKYQYDVPTNQNAGNFECARTTLIGQNKLADKNEGIG